MKILDILLNVVIVLAIMVISSYLAYNTYGIGLLESLPEGISSFFIENGALQYVAVGILVAAVIAKFIIGRRIKRQARNRT